MRRTSGRRWAAGIIISLSLACIVSAQANISLNEILRRNVEATGGKAKLGQVKNLSFRTGGAQNIVSAAGELKILTGKESAVTEAVLVSGDRVRRNSFNTLSEITGPQKIVFQTLAKLYAGLFSLVKFEGQLKLIGLKSFGPEKLYHLTTKSPAEPVSVHFYLRADDFSLKRLVFQGLTPEGDKYEVNYDFAPFEEAEGLRLPLSWFVSQVGTRGNLTEVTEVKTDLPLDKSYFAKLEINAGQTESSPGRMKGNVLDWSSSPFGLMIVTNWTRKDVERAGLRTGDKLILLLGESEYELTFYGLADEVPAPNELAKGARLLSPAPRGGEIFAIQIVGEDTAPVMGRLKALVPISVKKASN